MGRWNIYKSDCVVAIMKICVLTSGSVGNSTYIETGKERILIDMGTTSKFICEHLNSIGVSPSSITAIFISHTHTDHVKALKSFLNSYHPKLYLTPKMLPDLKELNDYDNIVIYDDDVYLADCKVEVIKSSHDTNDSRNFIITSNGKSVVYITDTGYINQKYFTKLKNKTVYLFESNHDIEKLRHGPYPIWLQDRILGPYGHLSNKDASIYLAKFIGSDTKKVILMHLSEKNNTEELAMNSLKETLEEYEVSFSDYTCAKPKEAIEEIII